MFKLYAKAQLFRQPHTPNDATCRLFSRKAQINLISKVTRSSEAKLAREDQGAKTLARDYS